VAWHFARLKAALVASAFKRGWQQAVGLMLGLLVGIPFALSIAAALAALGGHPLAGAVLVLVFTAIGVAWAVGPLLIFGLDETLDPARLRLLPLGRRQLVTGLLASSAIGFGPLLTLIVLSGAIVGHAPGGIGAALVVVAVLAQLVLCLVLARALTTALSGRLRSRKGRDALTMLTAVMGLGFALLGQVPRLLADMEVADAGRYVERAVEALRWVPVSWPAQAIVAADGGHLLAALGWLAADVVVVAGLAAWWAASLERAATTVEQGGADADSDADLFPRVLTFLPATRWGATAAKELRYQWRVPQLRANWFMLLAFSVALVAGTFFFAFLERPLIVLAPAGLATLQAFVSLNAFGGDRGAVWLLVSGGGIARGDLAGKNVATGLVTLGVVAVTSIALAALTGGWRFLPLTAAATLSLMGVVYGIGNVSSVLAPAPLPDAGQNMFASSAGTGCMTAVMQMAGWLAASIVSLPAAGAVAAALAVHPSLLPVAAAFAVVYGAGVWWAGTSVAARLGRANGPRIVDALST
jgi:ABC-2 type transport system permease protein